MPTRHDVSAVPPQGGYIAKQCVARAQFDILHPTDPRPTSPVLQRRFDRGNAFEAQVVASLLATNPDAVVIEGDDADLREQATLAAMARRAPLILNARLPTDLVGRRVGKPDLLVLAPDGGYRPVDIKHHMALEADGAPRRHKGDLLQLAHYQRMLETAGRAAGDGRLGGIIGVERSIVWHDLDAPLWRTPSSTGKQKRRSTMEIYDFEFDFRLDTMAVAMRHQQDASEDLLVIPFWKAECETCPWLDWCKPQLERGRGHVSLIPRMTWPQWEVHRDRGVLDRADLAALDPRTARLVAAGVELTSLIAQARDLPAEAPLSDLPVLARRPKQRAALEAEGIDTAGKVAALHERTAAYSGTGLSALPEQIDRARAALGGDPIYRRRGVRAVEVPRADVEVDVDMENVEDGVYLWGALHEGTYVPFATWDALDPETEAQVFVAFWRWLMGVRAEAVAAGRTFRAYCWHEQAENSQMRRIGANAGLSDEVEAFIASEEWIDLRRVFDGQMITGAGSGLKVVAPLTGFAWPVDDPGGGESMVRYDMARAGDAGAQRWLLEYNRGDVEATKTIRVWMSDTAGNTPEIDTAIATVDL